MDFDDIVQLVGDWDGVLTLLPGPGDGTPELAWGRVDLTRGGLAIDENKTNDPQFHPMSEGTVRALRAWRLRCAATGDRDRSAAEHGLGDWTPLDVAIPDLEKAAGRAGKGGALGGGPGGVGGKHYVSSGVHERGVEPLSLAAPEPKSGAYASFATRALKSKGAAA